MLPLRVKDNAHLLKELPIKVHFLPLEILSLDDRFISSGALEEINDVRMPTWREGTGKILYSGTFQVMGQIGTGTHWGSRIVKTPAIWEYLEKYMGMKEGDMYVFSNALPSFIHTLGVKTFGAAMRELKEAQKVKANV